VRRVWLSLVYDASRANRGKPFTGGCTGTSLFVFGTWPSDEFFLLSVAHDLNTTGHGEHHGPTGTTRFGLLVADVDAAHRKALDAGATERFAPYGKPWKPRTSHVTDPSGNWIDLTQA
jgi:uncharacterized glyoxalase superfamily protein PhnB